jgi:SAM-dependent methyltransferase
MTPINYSLKETPPAHQESTYLVIHGSKYTEGSGSEITTANEESSSWNCQFIAEQMKDYIPSSESFTIFEIGTGTAHQLKHYIHLFPNIVWQPSDLEDSLPFIYDTLTEHGTKRYPGNVLDPVAYDIDSPLGIPVTTDYNAIYVSNVIHCIPDAEPLIQQISKAIPQGGLVFIYGPFNVGSPEKYGILAKDRIENTSYTSQGNQKFDERLKDQDPRLGLRTLEDIEETAKKYNLTLQKAHEHEEVDNLFLVFRKE